MSAIYDLINLMRQTFDDQYNEKDQTVICKILSTNDDYTVNIAILPDMVTAIRNVVNASKYQFKNGDYAILYKLGNRLANSFIIAKIAPEASEAVVATYMSVVNATGSTGATVYLSDRAPEIDDYNFAVGTFWINTTAGTVYFLQFISGVTATWKRILTTDDLSVITPISYSLSSTPITLGANVVLTANNGSGSTSISLVGTNGTTVSVNGNIITINSNGGGGGGGNVGTLNTNNTLSLTPQDSESFSGAISLNRISKTGEAIDLSVASISGLSATNAQDAFTELVDDDVILQSHINTVQGNLTTEISTRANADTALQANITTVQSNLTAHTSNTNNPHAVTAAQVGLGNVDNTSDINKPISIATQAALDLKQDILTAGNGITIIGAGVTDPIITGNAITSVQVDTSITPNISALDWSDPDFTIGDWRLKVLFCSGAKPTQMSELTDGIIIGIRFYGTATEIYTIAEVDTTQILGNALYDSSNGGWDTTNIVDGIYTLTNAVTSVAYVNSEQSLWGKYIHKNSGYNSNTIINCDPEIADRIAADNILQSNINLKQDIMSEGTDINITANAISVDYEETAEDPWKYSITYMNGTEELTGLSPTSYSYLRGVSTLPTVYMSGDLFSNWYSDDTLIEAASDIPTSDYGDKTLYAKFNEGTTTLTYRYMSSNSGEHSKGYYVYSDTRGTSATGDIIIPSKITTNQQELGVVEDYVVEIGGSSIFYNTPITSLTFSDKVSLINSGTCDHCQSLVNISSLKNVKYIYSNAFSYCYNLIGDLDLSSIISLGSAAFYACTSITSVTIGKNVTSIGISAFGDCNLLTSVTISATTPPTLREGVFFSTENHLTIYVPSASLSAYQTATNWSTYANIMVGV